LQKGTKRRYITQSEHAHHLNPREGRKATTALLSIMGTY
jgi:hypothetical protein